MFLQIKQISFMEVYLWFEQTMSKLGPTFGLAKHGRNSVMSGLMVLFLFLSKVGFSEVVKSRALASSSSSWITITCV